MGVGVAGRGMELRRILRLAAMKFPVRRSPNPQISNEMLGAPPASPVAEPPAPGRRWPATLAALQNPQYRTLWLSLFASFSAMQMQMVARGWLTAELTGDKALALGVVGLSFGLPQLVLSLFGGAFADRFDKRKILLIGQAVTGSLALVNALLLSFHLIQVWHLVVLGLVQGSVFAFNMPARQAMMPKLLAGRDLMNGIALNTAAMTATSIVAPAVAGVLIAIPWVGLERVYYVIAALYIVVMYSMYRLPSSPPEAGKQRSPVLKEIGAGLAYTRSNRILFTFLMLSLLATALAMPYMTLLPLFARTIHKVGSQGLGLMSTFVGVGALAGSFFVASLTGYARKTQLQLLAGVGMGLFLVLFASAPVFWVALVGLALMGFCNTVFNAINGTLLMFNTEQQYYGRVMSLSMMTFSAMPVGGLVASLVAEHIGAPWTIAICGIVLTIVVLMVGLLNPKYRGMDTTPKAGMGQVRRAG